MRSKKIIGLLLAMTFILTMATPVTMQAAYSDNVLFEYDFEDYKGGYVTKEGSSGVSLTQPSSVQQYKLYAGEEADGNTYLYSSSSEYAQNGGKKWENVIVQLGFDDTFQTTGKVSVSFDIGRKDLATTTPSGQVIGIKMSDNTPRILAAMPGDGKFYGYNGNSVDKVGTNGGSIEFKANTKHRVDILFDLTAHKVYAYIDGALLTTRDDAEGLKGKTLQFRLEHDTPYLDNIKVAKVTDTSFAAEGMSYDAVTKSASISFTESLLSVATPLGADDFTLTDGATGKSVAVSAVEKTAYDAVKLTFVNPLRSGAAYNVSFSQNVKNLAGTTANAATLSVPGEEKETFVEEFEEFKDTDITVEDFTDLSYENFKLLRSSKWTENPFKSVSAIDDGDNDQAIEIVRGSRTGVDFSDMCFSLPKKVYFEGEVSLEYRVKLNAAVTLFRPYLIRNAAASSHQISPSESMSSVFINGNAMRYLNDEDAYRGDGTSYQSTVDTDREAPEYHTYKVIYNFDKDTADIYFDGVKKNGNPLEITNYTKLKSTGYFDRIDIRLSGTDNSAGATIDYVKVTQKVQTPVVKSIAYKDYNGNAVDATTAGIEKIELVLAGNIDEETLENITLTKGAETVSYTGALDYSTRLYTMTVPGLLAGSSDYTLSAGDTVTDIYGRAIDTYTQSISTAAGTKNALTITFTKDGEVVSKSAIAAGDKIDVNVKTIDTTAECEAAILLGACSNNNVLSTIKKAPLVWNGCVGSASATLMVESIENLDIKAFIWESLTTLIPVMGATPLN